MNYHCWMVNDSAVVDICATMNFDMITNNLSYLFIYFVAICLSFSCVEFVGLLCRCSVTTNHLFDFLSPLLLLLLLPVASCFFFSFYTSPTTTRVIHWCHTLNSCYHYVFLFENINCESFVEKNPVKVVQAVFF